MKNNLIIDIEERLVRYLSQTLAGRIHDKRICDEEDYAFPPGCVLFKDTGFQGFEPDQVSTYQPKKKPRKQELSLLFRSFLWRFIRNSAKPRIHVRRKPQQLPNAHV